HGPVGPVSEGGAQPPAAGAGARLRPPDRALRQPGLLRRRGAAEPDRLEVTFVEDVALYRRFTPVVHRRRPAFARAAQGFLKVGKRFLRRALSRFLQDLLTDGPRFFGARPGVLPQVEVQEVFVDLLSEPIPEDPLLARHEREAGASRR